MAESQGGTVPLIGALTVAGGLRTFVRLDGGRREHDGGGVGEDERSGRRGTAYKQGDVGEGDMDHLTLRPVERGEDGDGDDGGVSKGGNSTRARAQEAHVSGVGVPEETPTSSDVGGGVLPGRHRVHIGNRQF